MVKNGDFVWLASSVTQIPIAQSGFQGWNYYSIHSLNSALFVGSTVYSDNSFFKAFTLPNFRFIMRVLNSVCFFFFIDVV